MSESLASHGFVVAATKHTDNEYECPREVQSIIDVMYSKSFSESDDLFGTIRTDGVGVAGHSFGGYTAIAAAAGTTDDQVDSDDRIKAVMSIAGGSCCTPEPISVEDVIVPTLMFAGKQDGRADRARREVAQVSKDARYVAIVDGADHLDTGISTCQQSPSNTICSNDEVMRVEALLGVSFFDHHLRGEVAFAAVLSQSYAIQHDPPFEFFSGATADADRDGRTTFADFITLKDSFGLTGRFARRSPADFNRDDSVDLQDFGFLKQNFTGGAAMQTASVPEPSSLVLCSLAAVLLAWGSRRRFS